MRQSQRTDGKKSVLVYYFGHHKLVLYDGEYLPQLMKWEGPDHFEFLQGYPQDVVKKIDVWDTFLQALSEAEEYTLSCCTKLPLCSTSFITASQLPPNEPEPPLVSSASEESDTPASDVEVCRQPHLQEPIQSFKDQVHKSGDSSLDVRTTDSHKQCDITQSCAGGEPNTKRLDVSPKNVYLAPFNSVVWAFLKGCPWLPALVLDPFSFEHLLHRLGCTPGNGYVDILKLAQENSDRFRLVFYFGSNEFGLHKKPFETLKAWRCPEHNLFSNVHPKHKNKSQHEKMEMTVNNAVEEVEMFCLLSSTKKFPDDPIEIISNTSSSNEPQHNIEEKNEKWEIPVNRLAWASLKGFPWLPVFILDPSKLRHDLKYLGNAHSDILLQAQQNTQKYRLVYYFAAHDIGLHTDPQTTIRPWRGRDHAKFINVLPKDSNPPKLKLMKRIVNRALKEVEDYLATSPPARMLPGMAPSDFEPLHLVRESLCGEICKGFDEIQGDILSPDVDELRQTKSISSLQESSPCVTPTSLAPKKSLGPEGHLRSPKTILRVPISPIKDYSAIPKGLAWGYLKGFPWLPVFVLDPFRLNSKLENLGNGHASILQEAKDNPSAYRFVYYFASNDFGLHKEPLKTLKHWECEEHSLFLNVHPKHTKPSRRPTMLKILTKALGEVEEFLKTNQSPQFLPGLTDSDFAKNEDNEENRLGIKRKKNEPQSFTQEQMSNKKKKDDDEWSPPRAKRKHVTPAELKSITSSPTTKSSVNDDNTTSDNSGTVHQHFMPGTVPFDEVAWGHLGGFPWLPVYVIDPYKIRPNLKYLGNGHQKILEQAKLDTNNLRLVYYFGSHNFGLHTQPAKTMQPWNCSDHEKFKQGYPISCKKHKGKLAELALAIEEAEEFLNANKRTRLLPYMDSTDMDLHRPNTLAWGYLKGFPWLPVFILDPFKLKENLHKLGSGHMEILVKARENPLDNKLVYYFASHDFGLHTTPNETLMEWNCEDKPKFLDMFPQHRDPSRQKILKSIFNKALREAQKFLSSDAKARRLPGLVKSDYQLPLGDSHSLQ
ncbi:hypothetical protein AeMF1_009244 [Aphanomyces euteiches]|nr:hypothetical protein AeMF1_009244 [Aphanomyces euteiches]KAH9131567.1 hypothetical protein AeNC1_019552 [Aphanomyces euteiches]